MYIYICIHMQSSPGFRSVPPWPQGTPKVCPGHRAQRLQFFFGIFPCKSDLFFLSALRSLLLFFVYKLEGGNATENVCFYERAESGVFFSKAKVTHEFEVYKKFF